MDKAKPDKAQLTIKSEERLPPDKVGIELGVRVLDQANKPINAQPFQVHADGEILMEGLTNEQGEFSGKRVMSLQDGAKRKVFLVLEESLVSDWKTVGESEQGKKTFGFDLTVVDTKGKPLSTYPFQIQVENDGIIDGVTDGDGRYHHETILDATGSTKGRVSLVLKVSTSLLKKEDTNEVLSQILCGERPIQKGEEIKLDQKNYKVTGDILVEEGGNLEICPGTRMEFERGTGILCKGLLTAVGTKEHPITFKPSDKYWGNITLMGEGCRGSRIEYCIIEGGKGRTVDHTGSIRTLPYGREETVKDSAGGALAILCTASEFDDQNSEHKITLKNLLIRANSAKTGKGIYAKRSSLILQDCSIEGTNEGDAFVVDIDGGEHQLKGISIGRNMGGGILVANAKLVIEASAVEYCTSSGIDCAVRIYRSDADIQKTSFTGNFSRSCTVEVDSSKATFTRCDFKGNGTAATDATCIHRNGNSDITLYSDCSFICSHESCGKRWEYWDKNLRGRGVIGKTLPWLVS